MKRTLSFKTLSRSILQMLLLCVALSLAVGEQANAQSLSDMKNIKVDELSDGQIRGYIQQAEARGLTESQLLALAKQQNVPAAEIAKLQRRIAALGSGGNTAKSGAATQQGQADRAVTSVPNEGGKSLSAYEKAFLAMPSFKKVK